MKLWEPSIIWAQCLSSMSSRFDHHCELETSSSVLQRKLFRKHYWFERTCKNAVHLFVGVSTPRSPKAQALHLIIRVKHLADHCTILIWVARSCDTKFVDTRFERRLLLLDDSPPCKAINYLKTLFSSRYRLPGYTPIWKQQTYTSVAHIYICYFVPLERGSTTHTDIPCTPRRPQCYCNKNCTLCTPRRPAELQQRYFEKTAW